MERAERRRPDGRPSGRRSAAEMMREPPQIMETPGEHHAKLWRAINKVDGKANYLLGGMAFVVPFVIGTFIAVVLK